MSIDVQQTVTAGKVVSIHYTLKNDDGRVLDSSDGGPPLAYLHGADGIVPGLERQLEGKRVGEKFSVTVEPEEGYGARLPEGQLKIPRDAFPDGAPLAAGMQFAVENPAGDVVPLWITRVEPDHVEADLNHPLAGERLHFAVEVVAVRASTDEEREHGHPHGPDGHDHDDDHDH